VKLVEPPSCSSTSTHRFHRQERARRLGRPRTERPLRGLFVNRAQAVKYALCENGHHPETIVELSGAIELDMGGKLPSSDHLPAGRARLSYDKPSRRTRWFSLFQSQT
jgi:hypothetical protein